MRDVSRRTVLAGACGTCAAVVAGCATYTTGRAAPTDSHPPSVRPDPARRDRRRRRAAAGALAATADIPVGGGKIFADGTS